jgi:DNA-binding transcriptional regulator YdaS (Cro superfamily)
MNNKLAKRKRALRVAYDFYGKTQNATAQKFGVSLSCVRRWGAKDARIPAEKAYQIDVDTNGAAPMCDLTGYPVKRVKQRKISGDAAKALDRLIKYCGGMIELAERLHVRPDAVRGYLRTNKIPFEKAYQAELLTHGKVKIYQLIPSMMVEVCAESEK